jgi:alkanesulfonate monooxygenase SsuD/methylene tetrahydromethanopterin reductase-like flavin-dependent oxidoreductase (luciferase family)
VNIHIGETHEDALRTGRDGHDEYVKFLSPYGRFRHYEPAPGADAVPFNYRPSLEESIRQQIWAVGSVEEVAETLSMYKDALSLDHLCCFFELPGLTTEQLDRQITLFAEEVAPMIGAEMSR